MAQALAATAVAVSRQDQDLQVAGKEAPAQRRLAELHYGSFIPVWEYSPVRTTTSTRPPPAVRIGLDYSIAIWHLPIMSPPTMRPMRRVMRDWTRSEVSRPDLAIILGFMVHTWASIYVASLGSPAVMLVPDTTPRVRLPELPRNGSSVRGLLPSKQVRTIVSAGSVAEA